MNAVISLGRKLQTQRPARPAYDAKEPAALEKRGSGGELVPNSGASRFQHRPGAQEELRFSGYFCLFLRDTQNLNHYVKLANF